jgi:energy-coupling factor transporter ATP-binding protein EcfA2
MLTRLYCDNYKCLVNFEFRPQPLQLLMGLNGSGKSTAFEVLELIGAFVRGELYFHGPDDPIENHLVGRTRTRWQQVEQQRFELEVKGLEGTYLYELVVDEWGQPTAYPHVVKESVTLDGKPLFRFENGTLHLHNNQFEEKVQFPFNPRRSGLSIVESRKDNTKLSWLKDWLGRALYIQIDPKRMGARAEKEDTRPTFDLSNFAGWYRHLRLSQGKAMEDLRRSLQEVITGFESLDLQDAGFNTRILQISTRTGGERNGKEPQQYSFSELSDGERALVGLYTVLHCSVDNRATLCIDEPDNFVALAEIQPWLSRLSDMAEETGSQVLIASHHPELLNQLATRNGVVLDRVDGRQTLVRPFASPNDTTLTPAEIVARGWERG